MLSNSDFFVLDSKLALSIQPVVPVPRGNAVYWPFRPDARQVIDMTLGVLLSDPDEFEILGYLALPRCANVRRPHGLRVLHHHEARWPPSKVAIPTSQRTQLRARFHRRS